MNSIQEIGQAFNTLSRDLLGALLPSSLNTKEVTLQQPNVDFQGDEPILAHPVELLQDDRSTQDFLPPHSDTNEKEDSLTNLQETIQDGEGKQHTPVPDQENSKTWKNYAIKAAPYVAGAVAAPVLVTVGVTALGFTAAGITAGSAAAGIMGSYGGTVAVGSMCAVMQSIGAAGIGAAGTVIASTAGAIVGGISSNLLS